LTYSGGLTRDYYTYTNPVSCQVLRCANKKPQVALPTALRVQIDAVYPAPLVPLPWEALEVIHQPLLLLLSLPILLLLYYYYYYYYYYYHYDYYHYDYYDYYYYYYYYYNYLYW